MFTGPGGIPDDAIQAAMAGRLHERAGADEMCAATIFDARARTYTSLTYTHLPELGPTPTWVNDTRTNPTSGSRCSINVSSPPTPGRPRYHSTRTTTTPP